MKNGMERSMLTLCKDDDVKDVRAVSGGQCELISLKDLYIPVIRVVRDTFRHFREGW
jgi:hypothetical protein